MNEILLLIVLLLLMGCEARIRVESEPVQTKEVSTPDSGYVTFGNRYYGGSEADWPVWAEYVTMGDTMWIKRPLHIKEGHWYSNGRGIVIDATLDSEYVAIYRKSAK